MNVPDEAVRPFANAAELPLTPPGKYWTSGKALTVFVDASPPITLAAGTSAPGPKVPGVTLPAATLPAPPLTLPYSVPMKAGAVIGPPATMPDDVVMLAWFGPLAVNVPDETVSVVAVRTSVGFTCSATVARDA